MRFTKIKYDGSKVRIEYEIERSDKKDPDEYTLFSADAPAPSFREAMSALVSDVIAVCELPPEFCGWTSEPQDTYQRAASLKCAVDEAELAGHRNAHRLNVALYDDRKFLLMFPARPRQVR